MTTPEVWPLSENMCLLHALYFGLSVSEKSLFTCGGLYDPREMMRSVVSNSSRFVALLQMMHTIWSNWSWRTTRCWGRLSNTYGSARARMWSLEQSWQVRCIWESEEEQRWTRKLYQEVEEAWQRRRSGHSAHDHGVGIIVADGVATKIIDNGCTNGFKLFSMINLADRLDDVTVCFKFGLFEQ